MFAVSNRILRDTGAEHFKTRKAWTALVNSGRLATLGSSHKERISALCLIHRGVTIPPLENLS